MEPPDFKRISVAPNEVLLVRLPAGTGQDHINKWAQKLKSVFETQKIIVYTTDNVEFLKVTLEEKLIEELIDKEIQK